MLCLACFHLLKLHFNPLHFLKTGMANSQLNSGALHTSSSTWRTAGMQDKPNRPWSLAWKLDRRLTTHSMPMLQGRLREIQGPRQRRTGMMSGSRNTTGRPAQGKWTTKRPWTLAWKLDKRLLMHTTPMLPGKLRVIPGHKQRKTGMISGLLNTTGRPMAETSKLLPSFKRNSTKNG